MVALRLCNQPVQEALTLADLGFFRGGDFGNLSKRALRGQLLGAVANAIWLSFCLCVCHETEFYQNGQTDRDSFFARRHRSTYLFGFVEKFGYLQNKGTSDRPRQLSTSVPHLCVRWGR